MRIIPDFKKSEIIEKHSNEIPDKANFLNSYDNNITRGFDNMNAGHCIF